MSRIVLQPCHVRDDRFVPSRKRDPLELDQTQFLRKLTPSGTRAGMTILLRARVGHYVGLIRSRGGVTNFVFDNPRQKGRFAHLLKRDPAFAERVQEVYRVEVAEFASAVSEAA